MAQAPVVCGVSVLVCRIRATLLTTTGAVAAGPNNSYVSDNPIKIVVTPVVEAGKDSTLKGGCDCIIASYKGPDLLKRFELAFDFAAVEPAMLSLMLGATLVSDSSTVPVPIGVFWPDQVGCNVSGPPNVAFEFWTKVWDGDNQNNSWPYIHHVYPFVNFQIGPQTYEDDFAQPSVTGTCRTNNVWNKGPYGDTPTGVPGNSPGGFFYTATALPAAACGYASVTPGS